MENSAIAIGQSIRERREELGMTVQDLADQAGLNVQTVFRVEYGTSDSNWKTVASICDALELHLVATATPTEPLQAAAND